MMMTKNKKTSKAIAIALACALSATVFVGCDSKTNEAPEITGVSDLDCVINEPVDLLRRVTALDREDGDITPKMNISITPSAQVKDGIAVFTATGEYEITYSVTDSDKHTATKTAYVSVIARAVHTALDLVDMNGFSVDVGGGAKLASQKVAGDGDQSSLSFKVTGATADTDAALSRKYALSAGREYTFKYTVTSNAAGTAKVKIGDADAVELNVAEGENVLTFTHDMTEVELEEGAESVDVDVKLLLGGLGGDIDMEFVKAEVSYEGGNYLALTSSNVKDRFDGASGTATAAANNMSATLSVTAAGADDWRGGMFIDTGKHLMADVEYTVAFDLDAKNADKYSVVIQNKQWDEHKYETVSVEQEGATHKEVKFTPTAENIANGNGLWLYVQSGDHVNEITISNIEITRGEIPHESYDIDFVKAVHSPEETTDVTFTKDSNVFDRIDGTAEVAVSTADDNSTATLEITTISNADWHGGMFINTNCSIVPGAEYKVSFDVVATNADKFAVKLQNKQWGEKEYEFINVEDATDSVHKEVTFTPSADKIDGGGLWLYVMSGDHLNSITISDLKVVKSESIGSGNVYDRFDGVSGEVETAADKSTATLKITTPGDADWRGGMFVDTGRTLVAGVEYKVSFDVIATNADKFAVRLINQKYDEDQYAFINVEGATASTSKEATFTPSAANIENSGGLWLYVQSGDKLNEITISNLKVEVVGESAEEDASMVTETFRCHNIYKMFAYKGATNYAEWNNGKLVYHVDKFGIADEEDPTKYEILDWHHKIEGPAFDFGTGEFGDYYVSFKAKATAPVKIRFVGPVTSGEWDPTLVWAETYLSDTETVYTFKSNAMGTPDEHYFEWQFGWAANLGFEDVTIEISDIMICYKSPID